MVHRYLFVDTSWTDVRISLYEVLRFVAEVSVQFPQLIRVRKVKTLMCPVKCVPYAYTQRGQTNSSEKTHCFRCRN